MSDKEAQEYPKEEYPLEEDSAAVEKPEADSEDDLKKEEPEKASKSQNNQPASNAAESERPHEPTGDVPSKEGEENGGEKKEKKKRDYKLTPGILIYLGAIFCAFVFTITGMSIGMMDSRSDNSCITIWGYKPHCLRSWFRHMDYIDDFNGSGKECKKADSLIQGAQAFSVMCIIGGFLSLAVGILEVLNFAELGVVACIMSCINTVATLVTWSCMLAMYWGNLCGTGVYADTYRIGSGLALFITAWCLQMVGDVGVIYDISKGNIK